MAKPTEQGRGLQGGPVRDGMGGPRAHAGGVRRLYRGWTPAERSGGRGLVRAEVSGRPRHLVMTAQASGARQAPRGTRDPCGKWAGPGFRVEGGWACRWAQAGGPTAVGQTKVRPPRSPRGGRQEPGRGSGLFIASLIISEACASTTRTSTNTPVADTPVADTWVVNTSVTKGRWFLALSPKPHWSGDAPRRTPSGRRDHRPRLQG